MSILKFKNAALTAALAMGVAGAAALSNLSADQAQDVPQRPQPPRTVIAVPDNPYNAYSEGRRWGWDDRMRGNSFQPCAHLEYMQGNDHYKRNFIKGYVEMHQ